MITAGILAISIPLLKLETCLRLLLRAEGHGLQSLFWISVEKHAHGACVNANYKSHRMWMWPLKDEFLFDEIRAAFDKCIPDENTAARCFAAAKWPEGFKCSKPDCNSRDAWPLSSRQAYECKVCHCQTSLRAGTILFRSNLPIRTWLRTTDLVRRKKFFHASVFAVEIGLPYKTVYSLLGRIQCELHSKKKSALLTCLQKFDNVPNI